MNWPSWPLETHRLPCGSKAISAHRIWHLNRFEELAIAGVDDKPIFDRSAWKVER
jgi:hypothetical protein